jgi:HAD superfamily hydrolase (TIGR01549 family)
MTNPMTKLKPRAIIFDLGSTLIEYETVPWPELSVECAHSMREYLLNKKFDVPDKESFVKRFEENKAGFRRLARDELIEWDIPQAMGKFLDSLGTVHTPDLLEELFDAYYEPVEKQLYLYDDTLATLDRLKTSYPTIGLVSNTIFPERTHRQELKRFGIDPYLSFCIFSSTFRLRKPHPDIFYQAANFAGVAPGECVYIGDRFIEDVEGPRKIGMESILKFRHGRDYPEPIPEWVRRIDDLSEVFEHIDL